MAKPKGKLERAAVIVALAVSVLSGLGMLIDLAVNGQRTVRRFIVETVRDSLDCPEERP